MKKFILLTGALLAIAVGLYVWAADHIESPAVTGPGNASKDVDITDVYAFESPSNGNNLVFVCNTQGLLSPAASNSAQFTNNVMFEFNIDRNNDNVEDLVIQCLIQNGKLRVYGPVAPTQTGLKSTIVTSAPLTETDVTTYANSANPSIGNNSNGTRIFAGPRDDPFFFDLVRFREILAGTQTSFRNPGVDAFAGTNVMAVIVEIPKSLLGTVTNNTINVWAESKLK